MAEMTMEAFEPVTICRGPAVTRYRGATYRSDRAYTDRVGDTWRYVGTCEGTSLWVRNQESAAWGLYGVADQFGPLTEQDEGGES